jgi:hypothetical protein
MASGLKNDPVQYDPASTSCTNLYKTLNSSLSTESKSHKKALAFMNRGQANYNNNFQELNACVYPKETLNLMKMNNCSLTQDGNIVNTDYVPTYGIPISINSQNPDAIKNVDQDIINGKSLYPSQGCGINADNNLLKKAVEDSGIVIDAENEKILKALRAQIVQLNGEIDNLKNVKVPNQQRTLNEAIDLFEKTQADCNYQIWLTPWFNNVGLPWARSLSQQWIDGINALQAEWKSVNAEGLDWAAKCRQIYCVALFFEHCDYRGYAIVKKSGEHEDLLPGFWNDRISSIIVPPGVKVTLWEDIANTGSGQVAEVTGAIRCLVNNGYPGRGGNWNDQVTGIKVEGQANTDAWNFYMPNLPPDTFQ